jgi:hypothetical protein
MEVSIQLSKILCPTILDFRVKCELRVDDITEVFWSAPFEALPPGNKPPNHQLSTNFSLPYSCKLLFY